MLETKTKNMSIPVYDLMAARAKRKAERKAKRAANKAEGKARRQHRKDLIASMPGTSSLEKRLNYAAHRHNVKKADRKTQKAAIERARSVTPEQRKANQSKAMADHNKRLADAIAKHGGKKKTTKERPHVSIKQAWDRNLKVSADGKTRTDQWGRSYDNTKDGFMQFENKAKNWINEEYKKKNPRYYKQ